MRTALEQAQSTLTTLLLRMCFLTRGVEPPILPAKNATPNPASITSAHATLLQHRSLYVARSANFGAVDEYPQNWNPYSYVTINP
jgi:hypothetical protein